MIKRQLGELLLKLNILTQDQLDAALEKLVVNEDDFQLAEELLHYDYVSEHQLLPVLEYMTGVPYMNLKNCDIDQSAIRMLPQAVARKYSLIPVNRADGKLVVVMKDPLDLIAQDDVRLISGCELEIYFGLQNEIIAAINSNYITSEVAERAMEEITQQTEEENTTQEDVDDEVMRAPLVRLVNSIFSQAVKVGASDIHIEPMEKRVMVRFRKDGELKEIMDIPNSSLAAVTARVKIMSGLNIAEKRIPQDGRFGMMMDKGPIDFRVSILPIIYGEKIVIRILDRSSVLINREQLGFSARNSDLFDKVVKAPEGVILLSGPTGSGKTTTLYTVLRELSNPAVNVITVEDPVEYHLDGIHQVQVNTKAGLTFASGLRSILRQDPDIIMVGEIRDAETADIATKAAITGHIVLSTIHTNDTVSTISRLADMGIELYMVSSALRGVVAQRLVKKLCSNCKKKRETTAEEMAILKLRQPGVIYDSVGCNVCSESGYSGRTAIHEVLVMDREIRNMATHGETMDAIKEKAIEKGMQTLAESCRELVVNGVTSLAELNRVAYSVDQ